ncbi:glycosyltransferase family 4 protein [bacterium]|nr:glycosyltransferase family 4 protein [bacterium]
MRPRVGIDVHFLASLEGNRTYVLSLLRALARAGACERFEIVAFGFDAKAEAALLGDEAGAFRWEGSLPRSSIVRSAISIPLAQERERLLVWHACFMAPLLSRSRVVLAVHDALGLTRPDLLPPRIARRMKLLLPRSIDVAARVLVPTASVRDDLVSHGVDPGKTIVAPIGIDERIFVRESRADDSETRRSLGLDERPYVLAVGRADPRKQLPLLVRAFARLPSRESARLVLAGPLAGEPARALDEAAREAGIGPSLLIVDSPDERKLASLYRGASALAFPSLGEGLGLPVLEAFACGTPVVASDLAPVREAASGAALALVPPGDESALSAALSVVATRDRP